MLCAWLWKFLIYFSYLFGENIVKIYIKTIFILAGCMFSFVIYIKYNYNKLQCIQELNMYLMYRIIYHEFKHPEILKYEYLTQYKPTKNVH